MERENNARAAASGVTRDADGGVAVGARGLPARLHCIIMPTPCPSVAATSQLVQACSELQGGGACAVMVTQADGQVLQFSVAAVHKLAPLRKSEARVASLRPKPPPPLAAQEYNACFQVHSSIRI